MFKLWVINKKGVVQFMSRKVKTRTQYRLVGSDYSAQE